MNIKISVINHHHQHNNDYKNSHHYYNNKYNNHRHNCNNNCNNDHHLKRKDFKTIITITIMNIIITIILNVIMIIKLSL